MDCSAMIGFTAAALTTCAFFPQLYKTWKTKSAADLSLPMFLMLTLGISGWLVYGLLIGEWPVIIANSVGLVSSSVILYFKLRYDVFRGGRG